MAAATQNPLEAFIWGAGGSKKTPEEIARDKEIAADLLLKAGNTSPVEHWTQGAARVADALSGVIKQKRAEKAGAENETYNQGILSELFKGSSAPAAQTSASIPASGASSELAASAPAQPINMTGNEVYSNFMDTVKGSVKNPYALAAIAATGQRESQFSPGNVNRTWSDPSESGQPGTAGGIMSWRGPRYQALAATGDLSPAGQAKFFLQENPQLIQALNNAGSVEEAQGLMNKAWAFAGHDRPGGETAARLAAAQGFLPTFQNSGEVAAATPEAAIEAISPTQGGSLTDEVASFEQTPAYAAQFPGQQPNEQSAMAAQQPTAVQQVAQVLPAAGQTQQAVPGMSEALLRAISDPRATPQTRAVAQALMQQQAAQQAQAAEQQQWMARQQYEQAQRQNDPLYQAQVAKAQQELKKPVDGEKFYGNPIAIQTPNGIQYGQIGDQGGFKPINIGDGNTFAPNTRSVNTGTEMLTVGPGGEILDRQPIANREAAREKAVGAAEGETQAGLTAAAPGDFQAAQNALDLIESIRTDPYRERGTGGTSLLNRIPGTGGYDFQQKVEQAKGGAFLTAIQQMRGLGALSNNEGGAATAAVTRMNTAATEEGFLDALNDYEKIVRQGMDRAQKRLGGAPAEMPAPISTGEIKTDIPGVTIRRKN